MAGVFDTTKSLDDDALLALINALINLSTDSLGAAQSPDTPAQTSPSTSLHANLAQRQKMFGCNKLVEVTSINIGRIALYADLVHSYFLSVILRYVGPSRAVFRSPGFFFVEDGP